MSSEPILRPEDHEVWNAWQKAALAHAQTQAYKRRLDRARAIVDQAIEKVVDLAIMWSGGKDSTAMAHLIRVDRGHDLPAYSEKDDLDYPGERDYVIRLAGRWRLKLTILDPGVSLQKWMAEQSRLGTLPPADEDFHGRAALLSKENFYKIVESTSLRHCGTFLGLRAAESIHRLRNRRFNGAWYRKQNGHWICTPLADWTGLDVMAYLASCNIPVLDVYRCVAFMYRDEPWHVRKSWWIPGAHSCRGGIAWLRHYYPSLYQQLCRWLPDAKRHA